MQFVQVIDAKRVKDNLLVTIKRISAESNERDLLKFLTTPEVLADQTNHCMPLLDYFLDNMDPRFEFIVMPFL